MGSVHRDRTDGSWERVVRATYDDPALAGVEKRDLIVPPTAPPAIGVRYPHVPAGDATRSSAIHTTTGS